jgi:predicted transcriptional regulator
MMDALIGLRISGAVVKRLDLMAEAVGRSRSEVARFFLATACPEGLPRGWFESADAQRLATGRGDPGTRGAP